ncbi:hypothetical protein U8335_03335 [Roseiconus lacunae]|nr:hypothetical protein U8335_03335 [Stieleria sp. HD01]
MAKSQVELEQPISLESFAEARSEMAESSEGKALVTRVTEKRIVERSC